MLIEKAELQNPTHGIMGRIYGTHAANIDYNVHNPLKMPLTESLNTIEPRILSRAFKGGRNNQRKTRKRNRWA